MSAPADFGENCFKVIQHESEPTGTLSIQYQLWTCVALILLISMLASTYETIGGIHCYVAIPEGEYPKDKIVLFLTDVFGIELINNRLVADGFAANGFKTIVPDIMNGDPMTEENRKEANWDRAGWFARHGPDSWQPVVDKTIAALKELGATRFGTTAYCFGAPAAFYLAYKVDTHVTVLAHPSRAFAVPDDLLKRYKAEVKAPLLINSCEFDEAFPPEAQAKADEILGGDKFPPGYERLYWGGCSHGFAVKGDLSNPKIKAGKEGAFKATVEFFKKYL